MTESSKIVQSKDINGQNRLFGGRLMEWIDEVAALTAMRHCGGLVTTCAVDSLVFKHGAKLNQVVVLTGKFTYVGNTSLEVRVDTYVEEVETGERFTSITTASQHRSDTGLTFNLKANKQNGTTRLSEQRAEKNDTHTDSDFCPISQITIEYLKKMDKIIRDAGTRNPDDVLSSMGFIYIDPGTSLPGFIMKQKQIVYYGVNKNLPEKKYAFASFHEAFHGICGHLSLADFTKQGAHADTFENHSVLALTEREANIGAADTLIETDLFLEMSGYDSEDVKAYTNDAYCGTQRYRGRCLSCIAHFSNELLRRFPEVIRYTFWLKFADNMV